MVNAVGERYSLLERIGAGAMGVVWRAHDDLLHREVAVKQLKLPDSDPAAAEMARTRAMREARIAARLQHPNAIGVFDVVVQNGLPWLVMEYLPSRSLAALLDEHGPLPPAEVGRIGGRIAAALAAAHAAGIVHRDVKPANVLIGHDGTVKLTDFGISRAVGDGTLTEAGMISGTPAYLAPEVARGDAPDARSDVFSLGATLYAMTDGGSPYGPTDNNLGVIYRAATGKIDLPKRAGPLTGVMKRLLSNEPAKRPTAADAAVLLTGAPPVALDAPRPSRKWVGPAVAAAVLVAGIVGVLVFLPPSQDNRQNSFPDEYGVPTTTGETSAPAGELDEVAGFVRLHYGTAVKDPRTAWENLEPSYRPTIEEYESFWKKYDRVKADILNVEATGTGYTVDVQLTLTTGSESTIEAYRVGVQTIAGAKKIVSSAKI
ncbi:serine/threonine-protein kinase [Umezawaea sp. NPDC059074]|uniref:serine/threonine-protein kinase n=1 Tax=Umezawaea sp. NPDC059074 TaxID=3346716 RepID=UPI0036CE4D64